MLQSISKQTKWCVLELNCLSNDVIIKDVFKSHSEALSYLHEIIDEIKEYDDQNYFKKYNENKNLVSVYQTNYFYGKTLYMKYFIKEYQDIIN